MMANKQPKKRDIKLIISGPDNFSDYALLEQSLYNFLYNQKYLSIEILVTAGTQLGRYGQCFADHYNLKKRVFLINKSNDGNLALIKKNNRMLDYATDKENRAILFSFQDKDKPEDKSMLNEAIKRGIEIYQVKE